MNSTNATDISMINKDASCGRHQTDSGDDFGETAESVVVGVTTAVCAGCRRAIRDQYMLHVEPGLDWHASCLRCVECRRTLDESCTCFVRDGRSYCKLDYSRLFGVRCSGCGVGFDSVSLVMRARDRVYHVDCFRCVACQRRLVSGDEFAARRVDGALVCRDHFDHGGDAAAVAAAAAAASAVGHRPSSVTELRAVESPVDCAVADGLSADTDTTGTSSTGATNVPLTKTVASGVNSNVSIAKKKPSNNAGKSSPQTGCGVGEKKQSSGSGSGSSRHVTSRGGKPESLRHGGGGGTTKTTRIRTVLNEKQLHTLRTCYAANPRPDALMKDQLVEMTGLSSRVIRVWFQNKRCKDKKRTTLIKQLQQQHQDKANGVPMIASSPVRMQDQNPAMLQASAVQIHHQYVHHASLSSTEPPAAVLQPQSVVPAAAPRPSVSWSAAGGASCLVSQLVDYGGATSSLAVDDADVEMMPSTAAFQQLLDSFGCQSDVDDDDTVVSVDESLTVRARHSRSVRRHQQRLQSILPPQHHAVCSAARC